MSTMQIVDIVVAVICVIGYAVMIYFKVRGNIVEAVAGLIAAAEATGLCGSEKMAQVVAQLSAMVPAPLKGILSSKLLQEIAQRVFDWMRQYALNYIEAKKLEAEEEQKKKLFEENAETTAAVISELIQLSKEALIEKAESCHIELTGDETKDELIRQIILSILKNC